jgi:ribosome-binding protein aMBF1 (putative translation factor)
MPRICRKNKSIIRKLREHASLFQRELAEMLDISQDMVSKIELQARMPSERICNKLVDIANKYGFKLTLRILKRELNRKL